MAEIVKVDIVPTATKPVEGVHYNVVAGSPAQGDKVRIRSSAGEIFEGCYTPPAAPLGPRPKILRSFEVLALLPAAVVKAIASPTAAAAVVKRYEIFKITPSWTKAEGQSLFNDIEAAGLMTAQQNSDAVAAWPEA